MSLDVYLEGEPRRVPCKCECDHEHIRTKIDTLYSANITHNLVEMASEAGIYKHLWRPEEIGITKAAELIKPLKSGILLMKAEPERFRRLNSKNGWGIYDHFVPFVEEYLAACEKNPTANIRVSR